METKESALVYHFPEQKMLEISILGLPPVNKAQDKWNSTNHSYPRILILFSSKRDTQLVKLLDIILLSKAQTK